MSPITFFPVLWRSRSRSTQSTPAPNDTALPSIAAAVPPQAQVGRRPSSGETERPVLRRPRRSRHDSVLGLRWLA